VVNDFWKSPTPDNMRQHKNYKIEAFVGRLLRAIGAREGRPSHYRLRFCWQRQPTAAYKAMMNVATVSSNVDTTTA